VEPILLLDKISKRFGGVRALTDMHLKAYAGEVVARTTPASRRW
jgi:ABC-type sugar transport system ATPase subunit